MDYLRNTFCACLLDEELKKSFEIDKKINSQIKKDKNKTKKTIKILLLGAARSGKSTILKQMRIIHGGGYDEMERKGFISSINQNICFAIWILIEEMKKHPDLKYYDQNAVDAVDDFDDMDFSDFDYFSQLSEEILDGIETIWNDGGIQHLWNHRGNQTLYQTKNSLSLSDSTKYYFDNLERIRNTSYIPSQEDILRVRVRTSGINEYPFELNGITIKMIDVGGQKGERRKWVNAFDDVSSIMFLAAMSGYDEISEDPEERENPNDLKLAVVIFAQILEYQAFHDSSVILFLNKKDIFKEKVKISNIVDYFEKYTGPARDESKGRQFVKDLFLEKFKRKHGADSDAKFFSHFTCATSTEDIRVVFNATREILLRKILNETALN